MPTLKEEEDTGARYCLRKRRARTKAVERRSAAHAEEDEATKPAESGSRKRRRTQKKIKIEEHVPNGNAVVEKNEQIANGLLSDQLVSHAFEAAAADPASGEKSAYTMVRETLRLFNKCYLHMVQEEKKRCEGQPNNKKDSKSKEAKKRCDGQPLDKKNTHKKGSKSKKKTDIEDCGKQRHKRPDLKAVSQMRKLKAILYQERRIGSIPGIVVGHQFFSRAELTAVGCHQHWLHGIDYIGRTAGTSRKLQNLHVFRTPKKGWGVRSWDHIPAGAPICEYIGLLRRTDDLSHAADNNYVFYIDCLQTMHGLSGRQSRLRDVQLPSYLQKLVEESSDCVPFCIDAAVTGNFARFINHSCQPNVFVQCVLSHHQGLHRARVMFIAADNIPPLKELTYDYGYALESVVGPDGNIRQMACYCGAVDCRKRLY